MDQLAIYNAAPAWAQCLLLNVYSFKIYRERYGEDFENIYEDLVNGEQLSESEIIAYQNQKLGKLIQHCYESVPYYRELFQQNKLVPSDVLTTEDLQKIPVLTKDLVRENLAGLVSNARMHGDLQYGGTSGTTGSPLKIGWDKHMRVFNNAIDWRQKRWAGIRPRDKIALLLGRPIVNLGRKAPPFWQYDAFQNFLWMSAFHMSDSNLSLYVQRMKKFKPKALEGYPSTLVTLARYIIKNKIELKLDAIFSSSEPLHDHYRDTIESAFSCKVFDFYGLAERTIFASECEFHNGLHLHYEYGVTELLDPQGNPSSEGTIVATGLENYGMPLIRYKVNDQTAFLKGECECGRSMARIKAINTKQEDILYRTDGTPISPSTLTHPFKPLSSIAKSQIVQISASQIEIKLVVYGEFPERDRQFLMSQFTSRVGSDMDVVLKLVNDIPREPSGKYRWIKNEARAN